MLIFISFLFILILLVIFFHKNNSKLESFSNYNLNIIQTWKTNQIPNKYKGLVSQVKRLNPNCNYIFFSDHDIDVFIKNNFPQYQQVFDNFPYTIQKIDFFRYLAVYYYGGVYLDLDFKVVKSLQNFKNSSQCIFPNCL